MNFRPIAYTTEQHPKFADRQDLWALGDDFTSPGEALRRMRWLRDNGHNAVIPAGSKLTILCR